MKEITSQSIIDEHIRVGKILKETYESMDSKRGNREGKKLVRMFKILENNIELAKESLPVLFTCENAVVRMKAAAECISLGIFTQEAKKVLEDVVKDDDKMIAFNARMTLEVWEKQGYLKMYPTQITRRES